MPFDSKRFRHVLGHFPTGVAVVTALPPDGKPAGMAVGSFTSVSLDPPLVAFLPDKSSSSWPRIEEAGSFCVNILGSEQESVCRTFAVKGGDKFAELGWRKAGSGSPLLDGVVAWIDCDIETVHEAGDHYIVIGRVRDLDVAEQNLPLLFFQGGYGRFTPLSLAAWESDLITPLQVVDAARDHMEHVALECDAESVASVVVREDMVLLASAGKPDSHLLVTRVGQRIPFVPPLGTVFVAFAPPEAQQAWLDRLPADAPEGTVERLKAALQTVRDRGYSIGLGRSWHLQIEKMLFGRTDSGSSSGSTTDRREGLARLITQLPPEHEVPDLAEGEHEVGAVSVPVLGPDGNVILVLSITNLPERSKAADIERYAATMRAASEKITATLKREVSSAAR